MCSTDRSPCLECHYALGEPLEGWVGCGNPLATPVFRTEAPYGDGAFPALYEPFKVVSCALNPAVEGVVDALEEAVRDAKEIAAGHIYAQLAGRLSVDMFNIMCRMLVARGNVAMSGYVLRWVNKDGQ